MVCPLRKMSRNRVGSTSSRVIDNAECRNRWIFVVQNRNLDTEVLELN